MSNSFLYLRATETWTELFSPREDAAYMVNLSGTSVKVIYSTIQLVDPTEFDEAEKHCFVIGGTISQIKCPPNTYVYAKAKQSHPSPDGSSVIIVAHNSRINPDVVTGANADVESLALQIVALTERVTKDELSMVDHDINYQKLLRQYLLSHLSDQEDITRCYGFLLRQNRRLVAAEAAFAKWRRDYAGVNKHLAAIINASYDMQVVNNLSGSVIKYMREVESLNKKVDKLLSVSVTDEEASTIKNSAATLKAVDQGFTNMNNSLQALVNANEDELAKTKEELISKLDKKEFIDTVNALYNLIDRVRKNTEVNDNQETDLITKVDYSDAVIVQSPSLSSLHSAMLTQTDTTLTLDNTELVGGKDVALPLGVTVSGKDTDVEYTITLTPTNCRLSGYLNLTDTESGNTAVMRGTYEEINSELANVIVEFTEQSGDITIRFNEQTYTINVVVV